MICFMCLVFKVKKSEGKAFPGRVGVIGFAPAHKKEGFFNFFIY